MDGERGGPIAGFFWALGAVILFFGLLAVACGACTSNSNDKGQSLGRIELIRHDDGGDCDWNGDCGGDGYNDGGYGQGRNSGGGGGNGNRGRHGDNQRGDKNCHSFCGNTIVVPEPTQKKEPPPDQQPQSIACAVPVPWHCDPAPHGFIPPSPGKIPQQIADFAKLISDFVQGVIRFAV